MFFHFLSCSFNFFNILSFLSISLNFFHFLFTFLHFLSFLSFSFHFISCFFHVSFIFLSFFIIDVHASHFGATRPGSSPDRCTRHHFLDGFYCLGTSDAFHRQSFLFVHRETSDLPVLPQRQMPTTTSFAEPEDDVVRASTWMSISCSKGFDGTLLCLTLGMQVLS